MRSTPSHHRPARGKKTQETRWSSQVKRGPKKLGRSAEQFGYRVRIEPLGEPDAELARLAEHGDPIIMATTHQLVDLADAASVDAATEWWSQLTARGGEGMVVKPRSFIARGRKGMAQPAVKCRGPEYLRIIYGPEYDAPEHLARLRDRSLGKKRSLAIREFLLGAEALQRFVSREPLRRVHEAIFGVLTLETEPIDPRL